MPGAPTFDLQSHSTHSDGSLPPEAVVARAAEAGVDLLSLTDHDTVGGVVEALDAGARHGIRVVPGTELTAVRGANQDVHVLGYGLDPADGALAGALGRFRADRELRVEKMIDRLEGDGLRVDRSEIERRRDAGVPVGRPHLARAVLDEAENAERLAAEGAGSERGMFAVYLGEGGRAFVPRTTPTVAEAIGAIHAAGGVAVWAHPFWDVSDPEEVVSEIERFRADGLDGVECFYVSHTREQVDVLCDHCEAHGLLRTGSADFHGPEHEYFNRFRAFELYGREPDLGPID